MRGIMAGRARRAARATRIEFIVSVGRGRRGWEVGGTRRADFDEPSIGMWTAEGRTRSFGGREQKNNRPAKLKISSDFPPKPGSVSGVHCW